LETMMTFKEAERLSIMKQIGNKNLRQREASEQLNLSLRQTQRLVRSYRLEGANGLISKRRGKPNSRKLAVEQKEKIIGLILEKYTDFGPTLAAEKLEQKDKIKISREALRKLMIDKGIWQAKKKKEKRTYPRRTRRSRLGELVQADGSYHDWFEGRGERCCLIQFVDDATSRILYAKFCSWESKNNYFDCLEEYIKLNGKPQGIYVDKHGVFKVNREQVKKGERITAFHKALKKLKIELICANSPQAKGRVERKNGVLQDRLVKEMRLRGISSMEEGNNYFPEFIEVHNKQFGKKPANPNDAHRPLRKEEDLEKILATHIERTLSKNLSFQYDNILYQLETNTPNRLRYKKVNVISRDGKQLIVEYQGNEMKYTTWEDIEYKGPKVIGSKELENQCYRRSA
jgi:transposase